MARKKFQIIEGARNAMGSTVSTFEGKTIGWVDESYLRTDGTPRPDTDGEVYVYTAETGFPAAYIASGYLRQIKHFEVGDTVIVPADATEISGGQVFFGRAVVAEVTSKSASGNVHVVADGTHQYVDPSCLIAFPSGIELAAPPRPPLTFEDAVTKAITFARSVDEDLEGAEAVVALAKLLVEVSE